ncbi:MAG: hypothetical protein GTO22_10895 [Gemmatimonadales bacterium]|nr:hypothetical protein [Gemmatimonadales bacterium]
MADDSKVIDGRRYMWDGEDYASESAAGEKMANYRNDGFDTQLVEEDGRYFVYTRRVVADVPPEGAPP